MPDDIEFVTKPALATGMLTSRAERRGPGAVGRRGRGLRRRPGPARRVGGPRRVGYVLAIGCDRRVPTPAGLMRADEITAGLPTGLAAALGRARREGRALLRLGLDRPPRPRSRCRASRQRCWWLLVRRHRRTGELAFYRCYSPQLGAAARAGPGRRPPLDRRGVLPGRQGPGRARRAPGPPLDVLATLDAARDGRARPARGDRRERTQQPARPGRADPVDLQRDPPPVHHPRHRTRPDPRLPAEPGRDWRRRHQHRARTSHYQRHKTALRMAITIYGWSTSRRLRTHPPRGPPRRSHSRPLPYTTCGVRDRQADLHAYSVRAATPCSPFVVLAASTALSVVGTTGTSAARCCRGHPPTHPTHPTHLRVTP